MVATRIIDMGLHVCKVKALVVATSYQGLQVMRLLYVYPNSLPTRRTRINLQQACLCIKFVVDT